MKVLALEEPPISRTLLALRDEGWIEFLKTTEHIDHWRVAPRGQRLTATKLIKRFPVSEGRRIVDLVIAKARVINADPDISQRITEIHLFGSVLTGDEADDAGDIDLVVEILRRKLSPEEKKRIEGIEKATMPSYLNFLSQLGWPEREIRKKIKKVSAKISLHPDADLSEVVPPSWTIWRRS